MSDVADVLRQKDSRVFGIRADQTVFEAITEMTERNVGALVVWADSAVPIGIVTERDYLRRVALVGRSSRTCRVDEIMSRPLVSADPMTSVEECMHLMTRHRFRHLPILDDGLLVGMISIGDLVKYELRSREEEIGEMLHYIGSYPPPSDRPPRD